MLLWIKFPHIQEEKRRYKLIILRPGGYFCLVLLILVFFRHNYPMDGMGFIFDARIRL